MKSLIAKKKRHIDYVLLGCVVLLVVFGIIMVYSASMYIADKNYGDQYYFMKKQIVGAVIGLALMIGFIFIDVEKVKKWSWVLLALSIILLLLVFIPGIGKNNYGANRWINLGFITIQASEIAKFGFIFFAAYMMSKTKDKAKSFKSMLPVLLSGGLICVLIILEPNMSITMCVGATMLIMLFVGGSSIKNLLLIIIPALCLVPVLILIEPYRMQRLMAFLDPWASPLEEGFQLIQSYYALGSGGWFGAGLFNSRQKNLFLPFSESDFIFSIIGEELGLFGCSIVVLIYAIVIIRCFKIALKADTRFKCYLASGIASIIAVQTLVNIAVVTGSIPPTGLPLPFISAGSTSLLVFMSAIGVVLGVDRQSRKTKI